MQKYCDIVGEKVDKEDCAARKKQALQFRDQGQPHASLEKCVDCTKMIEPDAIKKTAKETNDSSALTCSHCKRGPGAISSRWNNKRGMHQTCYQNQQQKDKRSKEGKSKPTVKPPKNARKETNTFNVGDIVKHRASGKEGIISGILYMCEVYSSISQCAFWDDRTACKLKRNGFYTVNVDFNEDVEVHERFIEAI